MSSGANNRAKPLKLILKITRPKGSAGDTIDAIGAGKTKKDGVGIQPFKIRRKVSIALDVCPYGRNSAGGYKWKSKMLLEDQGLGLMDWGASQCLEDSSHIYKSWKSITQ
nr:hypothetical protein [Tanacetum cinerariifolium]